MRSLRCLLASALVLATFSALPAADSQWPQWRGPHGNGQTDETSLPTHWDDSALLWKTPLKGRGQSSPVIWGDKMFLTSALDDGRQRIVFCVDINNGKVIWEHVAWTGDPEPSHVMNGWASPTCATDGEVVIAFFGRGGLHAYTVNGRHLWSHDLGRFESPWGTAACPLLVGDLVIQNGDSDKDAFIEAFDRKSGDRVWRKPRPDHRGWSSPVLVQRNGREEMIVNGHTGVTAYDPKTGEQLWFTPNSNGRGEPTVTSSQEMLYVVCGLSGDMYALHKNEPTSPPAVVWTAPRKGGRDLPSPIVANNCVLVTSLNGIATCYQADSGQELWKERLNGQFSSSPIAAGELVYHVNEGGETYVIKPGPSLNVVARNQLQTQQGELFRASITPLGGRLYLRSDRCLYCIGSATAAAAR